jgi:hypothetical protein
MTNFLQVEDKCPLFDYKISPNCTCMLQMNEPSGFEEKRVNGYNKQARRCCFNLIRKYFKNIVSPLQIIHTLLVQEYA